MYSFVIPCYNSSESIRHVVELTMEEMEKMLLNTIDGRKQAK